MACPRKREERGLEWQDHGGGLEVGGKRGVEKKVRASLVAQR